MDEGKLHNLLIAASRIQTAAAALERPVTTALLHMPRFIGLAEQLEATTQALNRPILKALLSTDSVSRLVGQSAEIARQYYKDNRPVLSALLASRPTKEGDKPVLRALLASRPTNESDRPVLRALLASRPTMGVGDQPTRRNYEGAHNAETRQVKPHVPIVAGRATSEIEYPTPAGLPASRSSVERLSVLVIVAFATLLAPLTHSERRNVLALILTVLGVAIALAAWYNVPPPKHLP